MKNINDLTKRIIAFRNARDWKQFHNPKDVALSLVLEAAEVMDKETGKYFKSHLSEII